MIVWIILGLVVIAAVYVVGIYNGLVKNRQMVAEGWSGIDVQLKRRYDLIPNLVETAKAYMKHERDTLEAVVAARNQAQGAERAAAADPGNPDAMRALLGSERNLTGAMGRLFAVVESYPDLKADQNMRQLSEELTSTENKISFSRQHYNDSVMTYNTQREVFPAVLIAGTFNFGPAVLFEIEDAAQREAPKVSFS